MWFVELYTAKINQETGHYDRTLTFYDMAMIDESQLSLSSLVFYADILKDYWGKATNGMMIVEETEFITPYNKGISITKQGKVKDGDKKMIISLTLVIEKSPYGNKDEEDLYYATFESSDWR